MVAANFTQVDEKWRSFRPRRKWYRTLVSRSAVALILKEGRDGLETLMIRRAEREGDPWSGHMAFPGGRAEPEDQTILHTARRETFEEIGLDTDRYTRCQGALSDVLSPPRRGRKPMVITPYLFTMEESPELEINYEVAEVVWIPLNFLADHSNRAQIQWPRLLGPTNLPCYYYNERQIWGLSLAMLDELMAVLKV